MNFLFRKRYLLFIQLFLFINSTFGQSQLFEKSDRELTSLYSKIFPFYYGNQDSLTYYSDLFATRLSAFIQENPKSLTYKFKSLVDSNVCSIITSSDGNFRIYSWNTWQGGTMRDFANIFQFNTGKKVYSTYNKGEDDIGGYFTDIYTLKEKNATYYLAVYGGSLSSRDAYETISLYTISKDTLNDKVKLIKTQSGLSNSISFEYDFFSVADRPERPIRLIKYDNSKKIIYIPIIIDDGKVTNKYILYQFNGQFFEKLRNKINRK